MSLIIGVDVGGTFTDFFAYNSATNEQFVHKVASTSARPHEAIIEGFRAMCAEVGFAPSQIERFEHGTTVGTNTLIQKNGASVALITTKGFRDLLEIGRQNSPAHVQSSKGFSSPTGSARVAIRGW